MSFHVPCFHSKSARSTGNSPNKPSRSTSKSPASFSSRNHSYLCSPGCGCGWAKKDSWTRRRRSCFEMGELEEAFKVFDTNGDGKISATELGCVMRKLGDNMTEQELVLMVRELDKDGDGCVSLEEFLGHFNSSCDGGAVISRGDLWEVFQFFDADKNGYISAQELYDALRRLDKVCSVEDCMQMIERVDADGDYLVSFEEFQKMMV